MSFQSEDSIEKTINYESQNSNIEQKIPDKIKPKSALDRLQERKKLMTSTLPFVEEKKPTSKINLQNIGHGEYICKLSELYLMLSNEEKEKLDNYYNKVTNLESVNQFERNCALQFDLNEALQIFQDNMKRSNDCLKPEEDKNRQIGLEFDQNSSIAKDKVEFELKNMNRSNYPINYIESFDYFDKLKQELIENQRKSMFEESKGFENHHELLKTFDQIRREKVKEEREKQMKKATFNKRFSANDIDLDGLLRSNNAFPQNNFQSNLNDDNYFATADDVFIPETEIKDSFGNHQLFDANAQSNNHDGRFSFSFMGNDANDQFGFGLSTPNFQVPSFGANNVFKTPVAFQDLGSTVKRDSICNLAENLSMNNFVFTNNASSNHKGRDINDLNVDEKGTRKMIDLNSPEAQEVFHVENEIQNIVNFKNTLKRVKYSSFCPIKECSNVLSDLKTACIFDYNVYLEDLDNEYEMPKLLPLKFNLYGTKKPSFVEELRRFNYKNVNICSGQLNKQHHQFLDEWSKKMPYLDMNDEYIRSVIQNYNENNTNREDNNPTIVIAQIKRDKDNDHEKLALEAKKQLRMNAVRKNQFTNLNDEYIKTITLDKDSEIGKLLFVDKEADLNEKEEVIKLKKHKVTAILHTRMADEFWLTDFVIYPMNILNLYRQDIFGQIILAKIMKTENKAWRFQIVNKANENILRTKLRRSENSLSVIQNHEIFKTPKRLSLKSDDFTLIEYIEKEPIVLGDFGMGSRIEKWICPTRLSAHVLEHSYGYSPSQNSSNDLFKYPALLVETYKRTQVEIFGPKGEEVYFLEEDKLPTIGQLTRKDIPGVTLLENNLSRVPIFTQHAPKTDFLLVCTEINGEKRYFLRKIKTIYTAGQIQPKQEVFSPYSRDYNSFLRKFLKFYIKNAFEKNHSINIEDIKNVFPTMNDHSLRRTIKQMGGEEEPYDKRVFVQMRESTYEPDDHNDDGDFHIRPEDICLYKRMHQSLNKLQNMGIEEIKSTDRLSVLRTKFYRKNLDNSRKTLISKRIFEEIQLSAWNVSQSFKSCQQGQGRMYLDGFGDPTNGHGGINFIKLPLKISRYESMLNKLSQRNKINHIVTGTESDLRGLTMNYVHRILKENNYSEEMLSKLERWDKIELLREIANKAEEEKDESEIDPELLKFRRNMRMTTEKQKEKYQKDINVLFMKMIKILACKNTHSISDDGEFLLVEDLTAMIEEQKKELEKYKKLDVSDEEELDNIVPREIKKKAIVLKGHIKPKKNKA